MVTTQGHVKVMDFGLAKQLSSGAEAKPGSGAGTMLTGGGVRLGTPAYMSPEIVGGIDPSIHIKRLICGLANGAMADRSVAFLIKRRSPKASNL